MKRMIFVFAMLFSIVLSAVAFAHQGKTDSNGGHYDHINGGYHYHHGYEAHQHYDIDGDGILDCPFTFDTKNYTITNNESEEKEVGTENINFADFIFSLFITILIYGAVPILIVLLRKQPIKKAGYRWTCFGVNAVIWFLFNVYMALRNGAEVSSGLAFILWTTIFSAIGVKYLTKHDLLNSNKDTSAVPMKSQEERIADLVGLYEDKSNEELEKIINGNFTEEAKEAARQLVNIREGK